MLYTLPKNVLCFIPSHLNAFLLYTPKKWFYALYHPTKNIFTLYTLHSKMILCFIPTLHHAFTFHCPPPNTFNIYTLAIYTFMLYTPPPPPQKCKQKASRIKRNIDLRLDTSMWSHGDFLNKNLKLWGTEWGLNTLLYCKSF